MQHLLDWTLRCIFNVYCWMRVSMVVDMAHLNRLHSSVFKITGESSLKANGHKMSGAAHKGTKKHQAIVSIVWLQ